MDNFKKILKTWMKQTGKTRDWLAEKCIVSKATVNDWFTSRGQIPDAKISFIKTLIEKEEEGKDEPRDLQDKYSTKAVALQFSKEEWDRIIRVAEKNKQTPEAWLENLVATAVSITTTEDPEHKIPSTQDHIPVLAQEIAKRNRSLQADEFAFYEIKEVGNIAAGSPAEGDGLIQTHKTKKKYPDNYYAVRVCGASMEPRIPDSSLIVMRPWNQPEPPKPGTIVAYWDERGITLKELRSIEGKIYFASLNPKYPEVQPMDGGSISAVFVEVLR